MNARPLHTGGAITSFAMDGPRVALTVRDAAGRCDRSSTGTSSAHRYSASHARRTDVRPQSHHRHLVRRDRRLPRRVASHRAARLRPLVVGSAAVPGVGREAPCRRSCGRERRCDGGDGMTLASPSRRTSANSAASAASGSSWASTPSARFSPDGFNRWRCCRRQARRDRAGDGTVDVRTIAGRRVAQIDVGTTRAIALSGGKLVVLRSRRHRHVRPRDGEAGPQPRAAQILGEHRRRAVRDRSVTAGNQALAVDLATGRVATVGAAASRFSERRSKARATPTPTTADGRGTASFVPLSRVEALLGRA
jgi:hypothetical protein